MGTHAYSLVNALSRDMDSPTASKRGAGSGAKVRRRISGSHGISVTADRLMLEGVEGYRCTSDTQHVSHLLQEDDLNCIIGNGSLLMNVAWMDVADGSCHHLGNFGMLQGWMEKLGAADSVTPFVLEVVPAHHVDGRYVPPRHCFHVTHWKNC